MKTLKLNIADIFDIPTAEIFNPDSFKAVSSVYIDSRKVRKNSLFVAIKGENLDGHDFIEKAIKAGASAVVINRKHIKKFSNLPVPFIAVKNTTKALGDIAAIWRNKLNAKVIAITGSSGKTSTKELTALLLSEKYKVNKTELNNNNHIGVPLTILSTNQSHDYLIAEIGTNHFGEIIYSANILKPDISIITNIGNSHLQYFGNTKGVFKEKKSLFEITDSLSGINFINKDDKYLRTLSKKYKNVFTYSFNDSSDVIGRLLKFNRVGFPVVEVVYKNKTTEFVVPSYGEISARNFLAACAIAFYTGLSINQIKKALKNYEPVNKRLNVSKIKNTIIIDDTYNANPDSTSAAINIMNEIAPDKSKIVVLGDMLELGNNSIKLHKALASVIKKHKVTVAVMFGPKMKFLYNELKRTNINVYHFSDRQKLNSFLLSYDFSNSIILVKGSRGMRMEEFSETIKKSIKK